MQDLIFVSTESIDKFKASRAISELHVVKNPNTDKLFMTSSVGDSLGAVAPSYADGDGTPVISLVKGEDDKEFYLMHKQNQSNVVATF